MIGAIGGRAGRKGIPWVVSPVKNGQRFVTFDFGDMCYGLHPVYLQDSTTVRRNLVQYVYGFVLGNIGSANLNCTVN